MIYIASALISLFISASLLMTVLYLKRLYYKAIDNTEKLIEMVIKAMNNDE